MTESPRKVLPSNTAALGTVSHTGGLSGNLQKHSTCGSKSSHDFKRPGEIQAGDGKGRPFVQR